MQTFTEHFFSTFMTHYKMYQYVFCEERDKLFTKLEFEVEAPPHVPELSEAKHISVWEYEQRFVHRLQFSSLVVI